MSQAYTRKQSIRISTKKMDFAQMLRRYGMALLGIAMAALLRVALHPVLGDRYPFFFIFLAVMFVGWNCGFGPALLTIFLGCLSGTYILPSIFYSSPHPRPDFVAMTFFVILTLATTAYNESFRAAKRRAEQMASEARARSQELTQEALERKRVEAALHDANVRTEDILESITDAFIVFDRQWRYVYLNERAAQLVRRPKVELLGKCIWDMIPEAVGTPLYVEWERTMKDQIPVHFEAYFAPSNQWFENRVYPSPDGISVYCNDITERKRAEAALRDSEERFRLALENSEIFVFNQDRELRYQWAYNPHPAFSAQSLIGKTDADLLGAVAGSRLTSLKEQVLQRGMGTAGEVEVVANGEQMYWDMVVQPVRNESGEITGVIGSAANITERKRTEQRLRSHQQEIDDLNIRLRRAMAETHHRVKNNLQVIAALVDTQILDGGETVPVAELERISRHIRALAAIHDLLTQEAKLDAEVNDISALAALEKLLPMMQATVGTNRRVCFDVEDFRLPVRQGASLTMLVNELVSNAVKHADGDIELKLEVVPPSVMNGQPKRMARLGVSDHGPGFPPGFDPKKAANTGLQLIESAGRWDLQGETFYENRSKGGARVVVTFPIPEEGV
jgi:PAS domain S-box-containing protein